MAHNINPRMRMLMNPQTSGEINQAIGYQYTLLARSRTQAQRDQIGRRINDLMIRLNNLRLPPPSTAAPTFTSISASISENS